MAGETHETIPGRNEAYGMVKWATFINFPDDYLEAGGP